MKTLIYGGRLVDPSNGIDSNLNILIEDGKVSDITSDLPEADVKIDAGGKIVCPGFIDIHMHEDPVSDGRIVQGESSIFSCMLKMGVTTVIGGNCGTNPCDPWDYLDMVDRDGTPVNVGLLAGETSLREKHGGTDKYAHISKNQKAAVEKDIEKALDSGCLGVSFGIRYVPGMDHEEMVMAARPCKKDSKIIAAHIRSDAAEVFDATKEFLDIAAEAGASPQISHIGSMAGFGQMSEFLKLTDVYKLRGLDVSCDCYPYYAFSTQIGETTYDDGWMERYNCGYDVIELAEGKYKGKRCTKEMFDELRRDDPNCYTVCYVMKGQDVDLAFSHPRVMIGSDGVLDKGQGHPRAAGAFPRFIAQFVRTGKVSLYRGIDMMTAMPAEKLGLKNKGRLNVGADADIVIFDLEKITDNATFQEPTLAPSGIDYVLIGGEIAAKDCAVLNGGLGRSVRR